MPERAETGRPETSQRAGLPAIADWLRRVLRRPSMTAVRRLTAELDAFEPTLDFLIARSGGGADEDGRPASGGPGAEPGPGAPRATEGAVRGADGRLWCRYARESFERARAAAREHDVDRGWRCLHAARRLTIFGLGDDELRDEAEALAREADRKLGGWRKGSVEALLQPWSSEPEPPPTTASHDRLFVATRLRDEAADNRYYKENLARDQTILLLATLIAIVVAVLVLVGAGALDFRDDPTRPSVWFLVGVALFGALGASLSAIQSVAHRGSSAGIPEHVAASRITLARPYIGAAAALGVYAVLVAGLLQVQIGSDDDLAVLAFAFASGFTERLVLRAVEAVGSR